MADLNVCSFTGRVGSDPVVRKAGDTEVGEFRLAVDNWKGRDKDPKTIWLSVQVWGSRTAVCEYVEKGRKLTVSGELDVDVYTDKDGNERTSVRVNASSVILPDGGGKGDGDGKGSRGDKAKSEPESRSTRSTKGGKGRTTKKRKSADDDLPF